MVDLPASTCPMNTMLRCSLTDQVPITIRTGDDERDTMDVLLPKRSLRTSSSAALRTSWATAAVSVFARSRVKDLEEAAAAGAGDGAPEAFGASDADATALGGARGAAGAGAAAGALGAGAGLEPPMLREIVAGGEGAAPGLEPPMFREMVGGGAGASV